MTLCAYDHRGHTHDKHLVSASSDGIDRLWGLGLAFSTIAWQLASASEDRTIRLWDIMTGDTVQTLEGYLGTADGKQLASASDDRTVRLWDTVTSELQHVFKHTDTAWAVTFTSDAKQIASASSDGTVRLWCIETGELQKSFGDRSYGVLAIMFSLDRDE